MRYSTRPRFLLLLKWLFKPQPRPPAPTAESPADFILHGAFDVQPVECMGVACLARDIVDQAKVYAEQLQEYDLLGKTALLQLTARVAHLPHDARDCERNAPSRALAREVSRLTLNASTFTDVAWDESRRGFTFAL